MSTIQGETALLPNEALPPAYDGTGPSLAELAAFVSGWARS